ncbi:glycoside hydrolase family 9 protein [Chitinophaga sp. sic0106]|uniref:glycoside hydrolase family 9 protein n=1 Tax=Chitinophaga sp. sic0106 TaxID=2854785 RepID=UPI001C44633E|nr:glycoside hydrolase family 9 protein [Chitinophaga sp. sic0106]MBV7532359.1 glycoside hydrolase family 9 protein [Chitinophaga sp. sic0106]
MKKLFAIALTLLLAGFANAQQQWIRINQLGYLPGGIKVAVFGSKDHTTPKDFQLIDSASGEVVLSATASKDFGSYGPFTHTARLNFSPYKKTGTYRLKAGNIYSPFFRIADNVYNGMADFCLRYMRQQRSWFNPVLRDSCHTHDGYTMYGPMPDSTRIDVAGGWHDATDYLQYVTTSANATWHLLAAYRDFPQVFTDQYAANGLPGGNQVSDVLDEARWGLQWLLKMHPADNIMFNQIADDRDHKGLRLPKEDPFYGKGFERPVYFCTGMPQGLGKYKNKSTGVASTAGKFSSAFSLAAGIYGDADPAWAALLRKRALSSYQMGVRQPGVCQTASVLSPYIYAEDNWTDDMELAAASLYQQSRESRYLQDALQYSSQEKITPWLGKDTANHYQWYPFINLGHYELAKSLPAAERTTVTGYYREGISRVWKKAAGNAFYRAIPFIWCSNNLTVSFAMQCYWYRQLTKDTAFRELEQANIDWLFGCNPWGTSMVYGLPANGDYPTDPHAAFSTVAKLPVDGGLVDGPVYTAIYQNLIGIKLSEPDEYADFQSNLAVYHDDMGDYSTNEPTMDGTASLVYLLAAMAGEAPRQAAGGIIRGNPAQKQLALVFTGDEFADGAATISQNLKTANIKGSFFLTGNFYRHFPKVIQQLKRNGHYLGTHSDKHLLYCDWVHRDSMLVTRDSFRTDLANAYRELDKAGIKKAAAPYFLPPYEWYNQQVADWTTAEGLQLVSFTPGTRSNADYTYPGLKNYIGSREILEAVLAYEKGHEQGLNGFMLLLHIGTDPRRTDKFYPYLPALISSLKERGYRFVRVDELLRP